MFLSLYKNPSGSKRNITPWINCSASICEYLKFLKNGKLSWRCIVACLQKKAWKEREFLTGTTSTTKIVSEVLLLPSNNYFLDTEVLFAMKGFVVLCVSLVCSLFILTEARSPKESSNVDAVSLYQRKLQAEYDWKI